MWLLHTQTLVWARLCSLINHVWGTRQSSTSSTRGSYSDCASFLHVYRLRTGVHAPPSLFFYVPHKPEDTDVLPLILWDLAEVLVAERAIVLYWWGSQCSPMHCDLFKIYCVPPNFGITRTWICQFNFVQRPIFSGLRFFNEPEILDSGPPA